jgi:hypothetical protein
MFETGFDCTPLQTSLVNAQGLGLRGIQYHYLTPYTQGYNLTVQYEVTPSMTATVAYVGDTVRHLETFPGANEVSQIIPASANRQNFAPFPDFGYGGSYAATEGSSYYNSLQVSFEKHYSGGLNFLGTYVYSNARSDAIDLLNGPANGNYRCPYCPGFGIQGDYQIADFDIRNVFHFSGGYELPFGKGKKYLSGVTGVSNVLLSGWSTQWIATVEGGQPFTIPCNTYAANGSQNCNALLTGQNPYAGPHNVNQWVNPAAFTQPCVLGDSGPLAGNPVGCVPETGLATLGGAPTQVRGPGISRLDLSFFKQFHLSERWQMQFRAEFFNILNHPTFNAPGFGGNGVTAIAGSTDFLNSNFGKIGSTRFPFSDPRQIQFALKVFF